MPNVVLFGGSFNPVHMGHVFTVCYLAQLRMFDEVLVVPVNKHAYGKGLVDYHHRYEMCRLAMSWIPKVTISDIERHLVTDDKPNFTRDTIVALSGMHPDWSLYFAVGSDNANIEKWEGGKSLLRLATPIVIGRAGHPNEQNIAILPDISSTKIRVALNRMQQFMYNSKEHKTYVQDDVCLPEELISHIGDQELVEAFLPEGVLPYILKHKLYR